MLTHPERWGKINGKHHASIWIGRFPQVTKPPHYSCCLRTGIAHMECCIHELSHMRILDSWFWTYALMARFVVTDHQLTPLANIPHTGSVKNKRPLHKRRRLMLASLSSFTWSFVVDKNGSIKSSFAAWQAISNVLYPSKSNLQILRMSCTWKS